MAATLVVDIVTNTTKAVTGLKSVGDTATAQQSKFRKLGGVIVGALSIGAVVSYGKEAVKAASDDAAAQAQLASALQNTTGASDAQIAASEEYISNLSKTAAVTDDELRPALATLARGFGDTEKAQEGLALAADISAATGKPLATVAEAMSKAALGNEGAMGRLGIATKNAAGEALTMDEIMANAAETFQGQAAVAAESTAGQMKNAEIAMGEMSEQVGTALLPAVGELARVLTEHVVPALSTVFTFITDNISWLAPLAAGILAVVLAVKAWALAQAILNTTLFTSPIFWVVAAVVALIAIGVLLVKNWDKVVAWLKKLWESIKQAAATVFNAIKEAIGKAFEAVKRVIMAIWNGIKAFFKAYWEALKAIFGPAIAWVKDKITSGFRAISDVVKTVWDAIKTYFTNVWEDIKGIFQGAWDFFKGFIEFLGTLGDAIGDMWEGVTDTLSSAWEGVMTGLKAAVNFFIGGINTLIGGINSAIDLVNKLPGVNIGHIPTIPTLASGGIVTRPTLAMIGERGPEAVVPLGRRGAGVGASYTLNINTRRADAADVAWGFRRLELLRTGR